MEEDICIDMLFHTIYDDISPKISKSIDIFNEDNTSGLSSNTSHK